MRRIIPAILVLALLFFVSCNQVAPMPEPDEVLIRGSQASFDQGEFTYIVNGFYSPEVWKIDNSTKKITLLSEDLLDSSEEGWFHFIQDQLLVGSNMIYYDKGKYGHLLRLNLKNGTWDVFEGSELFPIAKSQAFLYAFYYGEKEKEITRVDFEDENGNVKYETAPGGKWDPEEKKFRLEELPWDDLKAIGDKMPSVISELEKEEPLDLSVIPNYGSTAWRGGNYYIFGCAPLTIVAEKEGVITYFMDSSLKAIIPISLEADTAGGFLTVRYYGGEGYREIKEHTLNCKDFNPLD